MSLADRKPSAFNQRHLFRSGRSDELYPHQHRNSVVDTATVPTPTTTPLTEALSQALPEEFRAATQAPFLRAAGKGTLPKPTLSKWLSQDRLYAETYICFISSLISRISLPYSFISEKDRSLRWRIMKLLTSAFDNIHRELDFFTSTAEQYGLDLEQPMKDGEGQAFIPVHATQQYMDLFRSFFTDPTLPLIEGMVVLWATEQCYLSAWQYASQHSPDTPASSDADGGALRDQFIPNWTSDEFEKFVDEIAEVTNLLAEREGAGKKLAVYKAVWSHVLDIEQRFWPEVHDD